MISLLQSTDRDKISTIVDGNQNAVQLRIAGILKTNPGVSAKEVWEKVKVDPDFISSATKLLKESGLELSVINDPNLQDFYVQTIQKYMNKQ